MRTRRLDDELLAGVWREVARLRAVDLRPLGYGHGELRIAVADAAEGIVRADLPALVGVPLDEAGRKAAARALARLEAAGLVVRLRLGGDAARVTHVQLIEA